AHRRDEGHHLGADHQGGAADHRRRRHHGVDPGEERVQPLRRARPCCRVPSRRGRDPRADAPVRHLRQIDVDLTDRHVVVVTGGEDSESQLADLKPFIKEYRPLLVGVDGGADLLRSARHSVDLVVGSPADVSDEALTDAPALVVPADRDGRAEGLERVSELGIGATTFPAAATARDMALLLAFHGGAEMIVVTGGDRGLEDAFTPAAAPSSTMVDKAVATRLVHADACSTLYRSRGTGLGLALVVLAALVAIAAVV